MDGFWIIEAADLDTAVDWAKRGALACGGPVEVRPFHAERSGSRPAMTAMTDLR